ncbi:NlpC/P60 family protein [Kitasatospora purpeofusca]|uniref:hypothetical protein n=1 Tax=Kitasatospora purpeofusca TaxID=67352 RepID=UPI003667106B
MSSKPSRLVRLAIAAAVAVSGTVVSLSAAPVSHAVGVSSTDGQISRAEVLARAQSWVDEGVWYSQQVYYTDSNGTYRTDCSGFVSMAWHLGVSRTTWTLPGVSTPISLDSLQPGDALNRLNPYTGEYDAHVVVFAGWTDSAHTSASVYEEARPGTQARRIAYSRSYLTSQNFKAFRYNRIIDSGTPQGSQDPGSLPTGTLVKAPNNPTVKLVISGSGLAVSGSDVAPDGYDLGKVVVVDEAKFNLLPTALPVGTVVHDAAGGSSRYVVVGDAALPISGAEWSADGYNTRPDMGVPTSWLQGAVRNSLPVGTVVHDQADNSPSRYVVIGDAALPISGADWSADGYNTRPDMGVPGGWLQGAVKKSLPSGTVLHDQADNDPSRYVVVEGAALPIAGAEWVPDGYSVRPDMGVPSTWLRSVVQASPADGTVVRGEAGRDDKVYVVLGGSALAVSDADKAAYAERPRLGVPENWLRGAAQRPLKNGTVVRDVSGGPSVYVMAGGMAVPLTAADYSGLGYDKRPLNTVPGTWLTAAAAKPAPADGTLLLSPDNTTVWLVTNGGSKKALTQADFGPGKYSFNDVVIVPTTLTANLPFTTS